MQLYEYTDWQALSAAACAWLTERAQMALSTRGRFLICLCGGSTPPLTYELWSQAALPWDKVHIFWGDERWLGEPGNHHETTGPLFEQAVLHPFPQAGQPEEAAATYEAQLTSFFGGLPHFDVAVQGLGDDGHTASLFPGSPGLEEDRRWVVAHWIPAKGRWRLSLTYPALENSRELLFLVSGQAKRQALASVLQGADLPATRLIQQAQTHIFCDLAARGT